MKVRKREARVQTIVKQIRVPSADKRKAMETLSDFGWDYDTGVGSGPFEYFEIYLVDEEDFEVVLNDLRQSGVRASRVRESFMKEESFIELPEDVEIQGQTFKAGTKIEIQEKEELKESHHMEIAKDLSMVRFDDGDSSDAQYIARDIFDGIVNGVGMSRFIANGAKDDVLEQLSYLFDDFA